MSRRSAPGIALVIVLVAMAVVAMLVLAFLATARTEHKSASLFSEIGEARTLSSLPVNIAISQIRSATEQNGLEKTWASQPGMIRVYGTEPDAQNSVRSKATALYKLYSDDTMVVKPATATATNNGMNLSLVRSSVEADTADLADWQRVPGMFVDINEPVAAVSEGSHKVESIFPICDPRATFSRNNGRPVDGFRFDDKKVPGTVAAIKVDDVTARLPMPVKWLYLLQDGQLIAPAGGDAVLGVTFGNDGDDPVPTVANPIVGRIAFWTDDDTAKINVNTATEGIGWDAPRAFTASTVNYARKQPAQNEFSRYPGHPAQTSLSPVFQAFGEQMIVDPSMGDGALAAVVERYHKLSPRSPWGGSKGGTATPSAAIIAQKDDRLYSTLDELVFDRNRRVQDPALTQQDIETARFFLTTHSRAPELSLFNQPRIMLWPVSADAADRNAKDKLLAFVGTGGGKAWYFSRMRNFQSLTDPGSAQAPRGDLDLLGGSGSGALKRNRELYESHLIPLTGGDGVGGTFPARDIPGFGGNFAEKLTVPRRNQVLTEMVDFLRWSVNSYSTGLAPAYTYLPPRSGKRVAESSAVPLMPGNNTKGFGRFPTITEVAIVFMATGADPANGSTTQMSAFIALEPFVPVTGAPSMAANVRYRIKGLNAFTMNTTAMGFPATGTIRCNTANGWLDDAGATSFVGFASQYKKAEMDSGARDQPSQATRTLNKISGNEDATFPFYSGNLNVRNLTEFAFSGGTIEVEVLPGFGNAATAEVLQTLTLNFPPATLKIPRLLPFPLDPTKPSYNTLAKRIEVDSGQLVTTLIQNGDVTRSVEVNVDGPAKGDLRVLAAMRSVPQDWFAPHPSYGTTSVERLHFLRQGNQMVAGQYGPSDGTGGLLGKAHSADRPSTLNTAGTLVSGLHYSRDSIPAVGRGQNGALNMDGRQGDFDNGSGRIEDGPYINKADENNMASNMDVNDGRLGYFDRHGFSLDNGVSFSPNRQITSAVAFGSLPSGIFSDVPSDPHKPWQTLLFCPNPASRTTPADQEPVAMDHEGFKGPRDHLWLDLFWMPVAEPYAISESFSTAGKINMNYQMMPFSHIERSTGVHAALKSTVLSAISPNSVGGITPAGYNNVGGNNYKEGTVHNREIYYQVNRSETLKGFTRRFALGDVFRSASEICEIFLVPQRRTSANYNADAKPSPGVYGEMVEWWNGVEGAVDAFEPTGDNSREAPYNHLYPRLTTKSNTYTVHFRVQTLKKARSSDPARWEESRDSVQSEYRGSASLERYLDPQDAELEAAVGASPTDAQSWDRYYRFRVIERKTFAP